MTWCSDVCVSKCAMPDRTSCGCLWVRLPPGGDVSGDVIVKPCAEHQADPKVVREVDERVARKGKS